MCNSIAISSKVYSAGDLIVKCYPLLYAVKYEYRGKCCDFCLNFSNSLKQCGKCKKLNYCDIKCQRNDWSLHKLECNILSKYKLLSFEKQGFDYMQRLVLRLYLMIESKPDLLNQNYELHNGLFRSINQMESHSQEMQTTKQFTGIINYFELYQIINYDRNLLLKLYGILQINSFGIDVYHQKYGISHCASGLYIEGSVFDHCCAPNACASGEGLALEIRAMKQINIGEQIFIDYVQNILPKAERQSLLNERYFFVCQCFRCQSNFDQNFDYKKLNLLEKDFDDSDSNESDNEKRYINCKQRYKYYANYYHNFHPSFTYFLFILLKYKIMAKMNSESDRIDVKKFITEVDTNMKVTHGIHHKFYQIFCSLINKYNLKD